MIDDLLRTKLMLPRLPGGLVARTSLIERLDAGLEKKLTLVSAPTGFGKSTLVGLWLGQRQIPCAWLTLDAGDNDPVRFWRYFAQACRDFDPGLGKELLSALRTQQQPAFQALLTGFMNELSQRAEQAVLVLENFEAITSQEVMVSLSFLIDHLPPTLHLVLIARSTANHTLALPLLRARGELNELHAADLRFSRAEIESFLQQSVAAPLSRAAIDPLEAKMEGWPAGLRLVILSMQDAVLSGEVERRIAEFSGEHRYVQEYLEREVIDRQAEPLRSFILQTCFLDRLTADLCNTVTGRSDSAALLQQLHQANLFLGLLQSNSGQHWYRYQGLFAETARHIARQRWGTAAVQAIQEKAGSWYAQHGLVEEAIETALAAQEYVQAANFIEQFIQERGRNEILSLRRWSEQLPQAVLDEHPAICFYFALALLFSLDRYAPETAARLQPLLKCAENGWTQQGNAGRVGEVEAARATVAWWQGDLMSSFAHTRRALDLLPEDEIYWRGISLMTVGFELVLEGQFISAQERTLEARALCGASQNLHGVLAALNILGDIAFEQGEMDQASVYFQQVQRDAVGGEEMLDDQALAWWGLGRIAYERNDLREAEACAQQAYEIGGRRSDASMRLHAGLLLANVQQARGDSGAALAQFDQLAAEIGHPFLIREMQTARARLALANGDTETLRHWSAGLSAQNAWVSGVQQAQEALLVARAQIAAGQGVQVLAAVESLRAAAHTRGWVRGEIEALCVEALAYFAQGESQKSDRALLSALALAQPRDFRRMLLDEGDGMARLLQAAAPRLTRRVLSLYVTVLLQAFPAGSGKRETPSAALPEGAALIEPLSGQEMRVLRLLAAGLSNPEIAQELVVSINTIKTQVRSIYRKLNVETRQDAREAARALKLW
jgi:LuxR family transcriptional regulator, maltose regulon positive regulatory protein